MKTTRLFAALCALMTVACGYVRAANIVWVSDNPNTNGAGQSNIFSGPINGTPDDSFITMLQAAGHSVIRFSSEDSQNVLLTQADIDALNTNDLIILGRSVTSAAFQAPQGHQWNTNIIKPLICQNAYVARNSRLGWFSGSDNVPDGVPAALTVANYTNPTNAYLFGGVALNGAKMVNNYDIAFGQNTSQINPTNPPAAGGRILATFGTTNVMVDFQAGTVVKGGANVLGGYRLYFACGNREPSGGAISTTAGTNNLTADGQNIFLRAVTLALNNGVPPNLGEAPSITLQPANASGCAGTSITLTSLATGENPLYYQWYFSDGATFTNAVANGTNANLTIPNLQPANTGYYAVIVTNAINAATSTVAQVLIVGTATVATGPVNATNCPGTPVTFTTTASGSGVLTYTWRKNGVVVQGPDGNNSYSIASVSAGDAATYSVIVSGECNNVTNSATLTVVGIPSITAAPQSQATPMGNGAVFSVTASTLATEPTLYQWQTNGVDVPGATGSTFAISNLTFAANGMQVRVQVANCAGSQYSVAAILSVTPVSGVTFDFNSPRQYTNIPYYLSYNDWLDSALATPPLVFEHPIGGTGPFPGSGALELSPNNGSVNSSILIPLSYDFSLPGKELTVSTMVKIKTPVNNNRNTQIGFTTVTNGDLDNSAGRSYMSVILQSTAQPALTYELRTGSKSNTVNSFIEGNNVAVGTVVVSNWYRLKATFVNNSATLPGTFRVTATLDNMGPLGNDVPSTVATIANVTITNSDIVAARNVYFVVRGIENTGVETRDNHHVNSASGPVAFVQQPSNQTATQGDRATFRALVDGDGPYSYQWSKNGIPIPGATSWKYVTAPTTTSDNGATFTVAVTGPGNSVSSDPATLTVTSDTLAVVSAGSVDGTTVGVMFNQPVQPAGAENPANYQINGANPLHARVYRTSLGPLGPDGIYVLLTPATVLTGPFTVTVSGVQDLSGGAIGVQNSASNTVVGLTGLDVNPAVTGPPGENYSFGPGQFIVTGGGADIFGAADQFRYVYTTRTGDFDVVVKVPYMDVVRAPSKAGFDARLALTPFSPHVLASVSPMWPARNFPEGVVRQTWNAATTSWGANPTYNLAWYPNAWLRFRRVGNTFLRYSSTNGANWNFDGQISPNPLFPNTIYFGFAVSAVANLNAESAQFENYGNFAGYAGATIAITSQPTNFTTTAGSTFTDGLIATLTGGGAPSTAGELAYIWQRTNSAAGGWTNLVSAGATNNTVGIGPLYITDNGAQFRVIVKAPGAADVTSATFTATVTDTAVPTISGVNSATYQSYPVSEVVVNFSEPVASLSALNTGNYFVTNANGVVLAVLSAEFLNGDPRTVLLRVDGQLGTGNASVGISGVRDLNNNLLATSVRIFRSFGPAIGPVVNEYFQDIGTTANITALTGNAAYIAGLPSWISYSNILGANALSGFGGSTFPGQTFSGGTVAHDNYGVKSYTYFIPPTNGNYKFWLRADDFAQLYMNTNSVGSTNPGGKVLLIDLTANNATYNVGTTPANSKTNITLVAGQAYYMEVLMKETGGGDGFSVMWSDPSSNAAPGQTVYIPLANLAYPAAAAPRTPVITEFYQGYVGALMSNGSLATLIAATNFPTSSYIGEAANWKYIAGLPDFVGYEKIFGTQPLLQDTRVNNYLGRMLSYFVPPTNGNYKFYIRSDDASQLWMNTNAVNSTDPAGKSLLGQVGMNTLTYQLVAENVSLIGGQKYFLEGLWRDGTGGDGMMVAVRAQSDPSWGPSFTEAIPGSMLEYPIGVGRAGAVNFAGIAPAAPLQEGKSVTLTPTGVTGGMMNGAGAFAAGSAAQQGYGFIWLRNGVRVLENSFTNPLPPLTMADNGAVYTLIVTNQFSRMERSITLSVTADTTPPVVVKTVGWRNADGFTIQFDERLDAVSATYLGNYAANNGLQLLSATLDPSGTMVSFRTSPQTSGTTYNITISGVKDASTAGNALSTTTSFGTWRVGGSGFLVELFTNLVGGAIADLTGSAKFSANMPDVTYYTNVFGVGLFGADSGLEFYGGRISGYFIPTNTGYYRFYIRSDDASQFFMNINSSDSENPAGKVMLIHAPSANISMQNPAAISPPVQLNAGQRYYTEALFKEGTGGDYVLATFRNTDANGTAVGIVPPFDTVAELQPAGASWDGSPGDPSILLTASSTPPPSLTVAENDPVSLALVAATTPSTWTPEISYQWAHSNANSGVFVDIPGAKAATLSFYTPLSDNNAAYRITATAPGGATLRYETVMHVTPDTTAPYIVSVNSLDGTNIGVLYNEPVDVGAGGEASGYYMNGDTSFTPIEAIVRTNIDPRTVILKLATPVTGAFSVTNLGVTDLAATPNFGESGMTGVVQGYSALDVGAPLGAGSSFSAVPGEIDVVAGGADIWGNSDQGHLTLVPRSGNFDIWTHLVSLSRAPGDNDGITKAGLMVRETLAADSRKLHYLAEPPASAGGRDIIEAGQRPANNTATAVWSGGNGNNGLAIGIPAGIPNAWMRIKRQGDLFTAYRSSNGVDWVVATTHTMSFSNTVYVGFGTTAHIPTTGVPNSAATTLAKYRDIHIPNPPTITVQPTPASQTVALHAPVSYSVTASNPANSGPLGYQWRRNGAIIPGATSATYSLSDSGAGDSGVYTVDVYNDGGSVGSTPVTLTVNDNLPVAGGESLTVTQNVSRTFSAASLLGNDSDLDGDPLSVIAVSGVYPVTYSANFNDGLPPAGATVYANGNPNVGASVKPSGGTGDSGYLEINPNLGSAAGSFVINELTPGKRVSAFTATFNLKVFSPGSGQPADGFSFNFGDDLVSGPGASYAAEQGSTGSGLSFCLDNYQFIPINIGGAVNAPGGGAGNSSGMKINYKGVIIAGVEINRALRGTAGSAWNVDRWVPVSISVTEDGRCTVMVDGTNVFGTVYLPNYTASKGRFGFYGRTGGAIESHSMDDLDISVRTLDTANESSFNAGGSLYGNTTVSGGFLHLTDALNGQMGALVLNELTPGQAVTSFSSSFKLRIGNGTGNAADGFSFNFANDLILGTSSGAEEGVGTGLSVCVDNYPTGGPDSPSFKLKYGGTLLVPPIIIPKWSSTSFIPVSINMDADGTLDVVVDGTNVVANLATPFVPTVGRFGMYARTGGENETHWVDDLGIAVTTAGSPGTYTNDFNAVFGPGTVTLSGGQITYNPPPNAGCGTDSFYYITSDGQVGGIAIGQVNVSIVDTNPVAPAITTCATNRTIVLFNTNQTALPNLIGEVVAVDSCGTPVVTQSPAPGTIIGVGTTLVSLIATDSSGLSATCQVQVAVQILQPNFTAGSATYSGGTFSATIPTVNGVNYIVEYTDTLNGTPPPWTTLTTITGDGTVKPFTDPGPLPPVRFYRIRIE